MHCAHAYWHGSKHALRGSTVQSIIIRQGRLLDPSAGLDRVADLLIVNGQVEEVRDKVSASKEARVIEAEGRWVTPGLIELSCESGEPGREDRETFRTMLEAAARGGFTMLALEPNTLPVHDDPSVTTHLLSLAHSPTRSQPRPSVLPLGALSKALAGKAQTDVGGLRAAGVVALSDGGVPCQQKLSAPRA